MNFFDQNSAPAISGNLANYAFRQHGTVVCSQTPLSLVGAVGVGGCLAVIAVYVDSKVIA